MDGLCAEVKELSQLIFSDSEFEVLKELITSISNNRNYDTEPLWNFETELLDRLIIDFGRECSGDDICLYREKSIQNSLQCARDEIEICNVNYTSKYVILYCGMHLEAVLKHLLRSSDSLGKIRYFYSSLEKLVPKLNNFHIIPNHIIKGYQLIVPIYNIARKITDEEAFSSFSPGDAVITYLCTRVLSRFTLMLTLCKQTA